MTRQGHLKRAPIVEAILDFRVSGDDEVSADQLDQIAESLAPAFPVRNPINTLVVEIRQEEGGKQSVSPHFNGYLLKDQASKFNCQVRLDGMSVSKIAPYTTWEELFDCLRACAQPYLEITGCSAISRVAARYINRIELPPNPLVDFDHYFTISPRTPVDFTEVLREFSTRTVLHIDETCFAIQQLKYSKPDASGFPVLLDIDVIRNERLPTDWHKLKEYFQELRVKKNQIFFGSITNAARDLFK